MRYGTKLHGKNVYIVDGCRTPFLKAKNIGAFSAADLAVATGTSLLNRLAIDPANIDEVILGSAMSGPDEANIARLVALRLGCGFHVPGLTVMRNCASGMQALDSAAIQIAAGRNTLILAGGTDAMSHAPLLFNPHMVKWLNQWRVAKTVTAKLMILGRLRPQFFLPIIALLQGLTDPLIGLNMGQTAEELAYYFKISRAQMDDFALMSHQRLAAAYTTGRMQEVVPIIDNNGKLYTQDEGLRANPSLQQFSQINPCFDKKFGKVTAANSSQITDGACLLILASVDAVKKYGLQVIGRIIDSQWAALAPSQMGLGPVHAVTPIMQRQGLTTKDIDYWEINEAFAAQVLACLAAWDDVDYCRNQLGLDAAMGAPSQACVNREGGAIAVGHPIGASGARIVLHVLHTLKQQEGARGMAAICIGGGQGGAMYLERVTKVEHHE